MRQNVLLLAVMIPEYHTSILLILPLDMAVYSHLHIYECVHSIIAWPALVFYLVSNTPELQQKCVRQRRSLSCNPAVAILIFCGTIPWHCLGAWWHGCALLCLICCAYIYHGWGKVWRRVDCFDGLDFDIYLCVLHTYLTAVYIHHTAVKHAVYASPK